MTAKVLGYDFVGAKLANNHMLIIQKSGFPRGKPGVIYYICIGNPFYASVKRFISNVRFSFIALISQRGALKKQKNLNLAY
jgi:hypothetical protein